MKRRSLLAAVGAVSVPLAGCAGAGMPEDAVVRAVQASPPEDVAVVSSADLPPAEREIVRTAVAEEVYHACPDLPAAIGSLAGRFESIQDAHVAHRDTSYAVWIRIQDQVYAASAPSPDTDPSCGLI